VVGRGFQDVCGGINRRRLDFLSAALCNEPARGE